MAIVPKHTIVVTFHFKKFANLLKSTGTSTKEREGESWTGEETLCLSYDTHHTSQQNDLQNNLPDISCIKKTIDPIRVNRNIDEPMTKALVTI